VIVLPLQRARLDHDLHAGGVQLPKKGVEPSALTSRISAVVAAAAVVRRRRRKTRHSPIPSLSFSFLLLLLLPHCTVSLRGTAVSARPAAATVVAARPAALVVR